MQQAEHDEAKLEEKLQAAAVAVESLLQKQVSLGTCSNQGLSFVNGAGDKHNAISCGPNA